MRSFKQYLEHVDPKNYGVKKDTVVEETPQKKKMKMQYESSPDCGWGGFEGNQDAVDDYVKWITRNK